MRKIVYSGTLKFIAVLLFIVSIVSGVLVGTNGIFEYSNEDLDIYAFEEDFSESGCITSLLDTPKMLLYDIYRDVYYTKNEDGSSIMKGDVASQEIRQDFEKRLEEVFGNPYNLEKINYYVKWNDLLFTNTVSQSYREVMEEDYYFFLQRTDTTGYPMIEMSVEQGVTHQLLLEEMVRFDDANTVTLAFSVKSHVVKEYKAIWEKQESIVINTCEYLIVCAIVALLAFIYLICVCGKNQIGELKNMWLDNIWIELHLALVVGAIFGVATLCIFMIEEYMFGALPQKLIYWILWPASLLGSALIITSLLSIVRNIKTCRLTEKSIILRVLRRAFRLVVKVAKWLGKITRVFWTTICRMLSKKTGVILITMLFVYTAVIGILVICAISTIYFLIWMVLGVLVFGFACFVVSYRTKDFDEIKKGVEEIRNGNTAYKIHEIKCDDMKTLAQNINDIAKGLDESVSAKVKAERLKTELITNVSHDLKTPITSIISYTELLSKIEDLPEEARDYVAVIAKKSDGLRRLTQDLFDISKVQSGNDDVTWEKLDVALLINQALAEHDNEIQCSGLPFCVEAPKALYIAADGRKMSRVLSNLISNILKYAMKKTRVFITAREKDGMIEMEFKNISAYPLNFTVEEITQRFVRGDQSRTEEGNGLGLAIAKSYTEICNGTFDIIVDGDMFKAILKFRKYR